MAKGTEDYEISILGNLSGAEAGQRDEESGRHRKRGEPLTLESGGSLSSGGCWKFLVQLIKFAVRGDAICPEGTIFLLYRVI